MMRALRFLFPLVLTAAAACGSEATVTTTTSAPVSTTVTATTADDPGSDGSASFPVPLASGGEIVSEFPGEVVVAYPDSMFAGLISFYTDYAVERDGTGGELFDGGIEYQFVQDGDTIVVSVTQEPPNAILSIRVLP